MIANNRGRKDKSLWTDNEEGDAVCFTHYDTDYEEASSIVNDIFERTRTPDINYSDFAILYRTNAQSRVFEEKMIMKGIPYKIIGSINFYQRKEIKDLLCYLKTIDNGLDSLAVKRIINVPRRGIGLTTVDRIDQYSFSNNMGFYDAMKHAEYIDGLGRSTSKIISFVSFIESMKSKIGKPGYTLKNLLEEIVEGTGYVKELEATGEEEANDRKANIDELINKIAYYEENSPEIPTLSGFLEEVALIADIDNLKDDNNMVVLMTLHSAKGLEFPYVYLCGMEEGIFPSYMSLNAENPEIEIEEERRLCYVGITRAMKHLSLSAARQRMIRGETQANKPSRFISEIPRYLITIKSPGQKSHFASEKIYSFNKPINKTVNQSKKNSSPTKTNSYQPYSNTKKQFGTAELLAPEYSIGDSVRHVKFGVGIVTDIVRGGKDYEVTVDFKGSGVKKMLSSFAKLIKI